MPDIVQDPLRELSKALVEHTTRAQSLVARIEAAGRPIRSGTLWRKDVIVAAEQALAHVEEAKVVLGDGSSFAARMAGRDAGTNVVALKLDGTPEPVPLAAAEPHPGALALAFGADDAGVSVRLGVIHSVGPAWHSRAGGRIDRRVVLVIPTTTVEAVLEPLLSKGRVERGWLGLALQPVLVPDAMQTEAGQSRGLMIMGVAKEGPAAQAGVLVGDILVTIGGENVSHPAMVAQRLGPEAVGQPIELRLLRAGKLLSLTATVAARPSG